MAISLVAFSPPPERQRGFALGRASMDRTATGRSPSPAPAGDHKRRSASCQYVTTNSGGQEKAVRKASKQWNMLRTTDEELLCGVAGYSLLSPQIFGAQFREGGASFFIQGGD